MSNTQKHWSLALFTVTYIVVLLFFAPISNAAPILGRHLVVQSDGHVEVSYQGSSALFTSTLRYNQGGGINSPRVDLFTTSQTPLFSTVNLGQFSRGQILSFELFVHDTGNIFRTGGPNFNPDGVAHALVNDMWGGSNEVLVGFEDMFGGGDMDYNDHMFGFSNIEIGGPLSEPQPVPTPEPGGWVLLSTGLMCLGAYRKFLRYDVC